MGVSTFIKLGKTAVQGKAALDSFDAHDATHNATKLGKKAATAPLRAWENIPRWVVRGLQLLVALVAAGFYGRRPGEPQAPGWVYVFGVIIGGLSAVTAVAFAVAGALSAFSARCRTYRLFAWDATLFVLWIVVFGVTYSIFHGHDDKGDDKGASSRTMKGVAWLDLASAVLWLVSAVYGAIKTFVGGKVDDVAGRVTGRVAGKVDGVHGRVAGKVDGVTGQVAGKVDGATGRVAEKLFGPKKGPDPASKEGGFYEV
ncbi:hypothetical protein B0T26DRAFT_682003 [Lasiosphaeria miniovina]|uniref:MARVEL domain-containing protein n=1 Tax=Lasiosphaeria miniovina TaxID=1954250 RepID=A0AA39ZQM7_9PEZI|nr:uncharacterized protein B0T26DRAFT_682003 [Lasiosphaeria miniovina]KAK0701905.1 hypothetical protein B0T26DRAFT_682003 [Lasiosphaeria miniovina]